MLRTALRDKAGQCMDRGQPLVARRGGAAATLFDVPKKLLHAIGRDVNDGQPVDRRVRVSADERYEQRQGVSVAPLRVAGEVALVLPR